MQCYFIKYSENFLQGQSDSASSLDLQGLVGSPSWKSPSTDGKEDGREFIPGSEWIDKHEDEITLMSNKPENRSKTQLEKRHSSLKREPPQVTVENNKCNVDKGFEVRKISFEEEANESDETTTSDCSETNLMWQLNVQVNMPRVAASNNGSLASSTKLKKTQSKISRVAAETK